MAKIGLPKGSGKRLKVREKSVKSQGILKWILSGNPEYEISIVKISVSNKDSEEDVHMCKLDSLCFLHSQRLDVEAGSG